jgi:hypothetical protein
MWGVPGDLDLADLPDDVTAEYLVQRIVEWMPAEKVDAHLDDDGEEHTHTETVWFPVMLGSCSKGGGHAPGYTYIGPVHVSDTYKDALNYAKKVLKHLRTQRDDMMHGFEKLTAEAAAAEALEKDL